MSLSQNLRQRRQTMGLTISHLARLTNVSRSYLSQIESNEDASPSADFLYRIAFALQTSIPELLGKDGADSEMPDVNDALRDFALQEALGNDEVIMLAGIHYRGIRPMTMKGYWFIWEAIRLSISKGEAL